MRTIKLLVAYDGYAYHGFQKQKDFITIQSVLEEMLSRVCGEPIRIAGSGRTDAGVHALGQVVSFTTTGRIPCANIVKAASMLPKDIVIISAEETETDFHARFSARWKTYEYKIIVNSHHDPFMARYAWQIRQHPDVEAMDKAAELLLGTHDFSAFRSSGSVDSSPVKTIYKACCSEKGEKIVFRISGDGFLYHMVRNIVWALVQIGLGQLKKEDVTVALATGQCAFDSRPAPAQGLYLVQVGYGNYPDLT